MKINKKMFILSVTFEKVTKDLSEFNFDSEDIIK